MSAKAWRFDEFVLDARQCELRRNGTPIPVEPQVFDVLVHLVAHHDRVVSRDELLNVIWGPGNASEASLSSRIKAARRALGDTGAAQTWIRTVRGRGYRFVRVPTWVESEQGVKAAEPMPPQRVAYTRAHDGVRLAYGVAGTGPPLVRAAHWMTHLGYDADSPVWRHWVAGLASKRRLIRYDERGCGMSDWAVGDFTFEDWVTDLETVVDALDLDRFPLLGVSQGGAVAVAYAARHPARVSRLILVGAYACGRAKRAVGDPERRLAALDIELARWGWGRDDPAFRQVFAAQFQPDGSREEWNAFDELQRRTTTPENAARFLEQFAEVDVLDLARKIECPTLVMHSREDHRVPYWCAEQLTAAIAGARLVSLPSRNHLLTEDEPAWRLFLDEVDGFLGT
ncbi:MAG: alpha/beta fold hydrolase [Actinomycetota bacterium]